MTMNWGKVIGVSLVAGVSMTVVCSIVLRGFVPGDHVASLRTTERRVAERPEVDSMLNTDFSDAPAGAAPRRAQASMSMGMMHEGSVSIGRHYVDLGAASVSMYGVSTSVARRAADGILTNYAQSSSTHRPWWQADFLSDVLKVSAVEITPYSTSQVPLTISVDGIVCATITDFPSNDPLKVPCSAFGSKVRIHLSDRTSSGALLLREVRIEVEGDGMLKPQGHKIICPFLGTLNNEHVLIGCNHTRMMLLNVTIAAGLNESLAVAHIDSNFRNLPDDFQNICEMEGAMNEHITSTGINDCVTTFINCMPNHDGNKATCETNTRDKQCGAPNATRFETFFNTLDVNRDSYLSTSELASGASGLDFNDANPEGEGTIAGSFGFLLEIFANNGRIHKTNLAKLVLERRFPPGYFFG